jgi:hypothetical protein
MYLVGRNFYGRFLPQVREVAGPTEGEAIVRKHLADVAGHAWLAQPQRTNPILGYPPQPAPATAGGAAP